jgi:hypothetical protein
MWTMNMRRLVDNGRGLTIHNCGLADKWRRRSLAGKRWCLTAYREMSLTEQRRRLLKKWGWLTTIHGGHY